MTARGVVIGIGSDQGPDRIGLEIVAALREEASLGPPAVRVYPCRAPATELPVLLRDCDWALLVDAVRAGGEPGTVLHLDAVDLAHDHCPASTHGLGVSATLALLQLLGELPPAVAIVGIEVGPVEHPPTAQWIAAGVAAVQATVARLQALGA